MLTAEEAKEIMEQKRSQKLKKKPTKRALKQIERLILKAAKDGESSTTVYFDSTYWNRDEIISELQKLDYIVRYDCPYIDIQWTRQ